MRLTKRTAVAALAVLFPIAAFADLTGTVTLSKNTSINLETGETIAAGGDLLWNGSTLAPQGKALAAVFTAPYATLTQTQLQQGLAQGSSAAIGSPAAGTVIGVLDNNGNVAKLMVTALVTGTSITLQYDTYGTISTPVIPTPPVGTPGTPAITQLQNNYSYILPGLPNYGIAPGTLFIIQGSNLATGKTVSQLQTSASPGLPTSLNGASITVTVNGTTVHPGIYYAIASQIAAVLPSTTPTGTGTITVSYNLVPSNSASITVVPTALGLDTYYSSGSGLAFAADLSYNLITYTNSAKPGQTIILWGSGLGADLADSDIVYTLTPHAVNVPLVIYIGGIPATILYAGSSGFPGLNQFNVTIPSSVSTGCGISLVAVSGTAPNNMLSNTVALPIAAAGGVCSDPVIGDNGTSILNQGGQSAAYTNANLSIVQSTTGQVVQTTATGTFESIQPTSTSGTGGSVVSLGNCSVTGVGGGTSTASPPSITGLDAGTITVTGPIGPQTLVPQTTGVYSVQLANAFLPATGGAFTFTGSGGKQVGSFTTSISLTNPLSWTNMSAINSITRANGLNVTWTGGVPNTYVAITGTSLLSNSAVGTSFTCYAPVSAGQFTVPSYVLLGLPASASGGLTVSNAAAPGTFTASGLTAAGTVNAQVTFAISPAYQ
jgi:uncharacterized protein (TIGR03437 family)